MFNAQYFRTYITLVETGSFTQTARRLDMTQPGVSQHIRKLEQYLARPLLHRHGRRFTLTETGRRTYDYAIKLFAEHDYFRHSLDDDSLDSGDCRLASPASVGLMFYPFLLGYQQMYPGLTISYRFAANDDIIKDVAAGHYDLGIITDMGRHPDLSFSPWYQEPLSLVVPADFTGTSLTELLALGFLSYPGGVEHATRLLQGGFGEEFHSMKRFPRRGFVSEISMVLDAVARGLGFTAVSRAVLETSPWQRQVKELNFSEPVYETLFIVARRRSDIPKRYTRLLDDFRQQRRAALYGLSAEPSFVTE